MVRMFQPKRELTGTNPTAQEKTEDKAIEKQALGLIEFARAAIDAKQNKTRRHGCGHRHATSVPPNA